MGTDGEKGDGKDKPYDEISEFLKRFYKPEKEIEPEIFWEEVSKKIDSLFHKELQSEKIVNEQGVLLSEEERYWLGLEEYLKNEVSSLKHKAITDHLLHCKVCRQNHNDLLDKKKPMIDLMNIGIRSVFEQQLL
ncbi:MAG: hypothetical protein HY094_03195 [Candidatus Melainabacteria bacterium]|nr:hypothetical protein [Candidatus Melainabacteria bacterium]